MHLVPFFVHLEHCGRNRSHRPLEVAQAWQAFLLVGPEAPDKHRFVCLNRDDSWISSAESGSLKQPTLSELPVTFSAD